MSAVFLLDQVLACTESATSEYSTTSQCLSALLVTGPARESEVYSKRPQMEKNQRTYRTYTTTVWRLSTLKFITRQLLEAEMEATLEEGGGWSARTHPP